jgi:hypothetical protein
MPSAPSSAGGASKRQPRRLTGCILWIVRRVCPACKRSAGPLPAVLLFHLASSRRRGGWRHERRTSDHHRSRSAVRTVGEAAELLRPRRGRGAPVGGRRGMGKTTGDRSRGACDGRNGRRRRPDWLHRSRAAASHPVDRRSGPPFGASRRGARGAALLLLADLVAPTIVTPAEAPVGSITALAGASFFLLLALQTRQGRRVFA